MKYDNIQTSLEETETSPLTPTTSNQLPKSNVLLGFLIALAAHLSIALSQFFMKKCQPKLPPFQVQYYCHIQLLVISYILCRYKKITTVFTKPQPNRYVIIRGIIGIFGSSGLLYSLSKLPLSEVIVIGNTSPVITSVLAIFVLKETLDLPLALNIVFSIIGVLFIAQPGFLFSSNDVSGDKSIEILGYIAAITSATTTGIVPLLLKKVGNAVQPLAFTFFFGVMILLISPFGMFNQYVVSIDVYDIFKLMGGGVFMMTGQTLWAVSASYAEASKLSMALYSQIVFAYMLEIFVDKVYPNTYKMFGTFLILSGFFVMLRKAFIQSNQASASKS